MTEHRISRAGLEKRMDFLYRTKEKMLDLANLTLVGADGVGEYILFYGNGNTPKGYIILATNTVILPELGK